MARIDIDRLSEEELIDLNHRIISRLRFLRDMRSHAAMVNFRIGEKVRFRPAGHPEIKGTLTRYNKKSVTIIAEDGMRWNVHPSFLLRVGPNPNTVTPNTSERSRESTPEDSLILFPKQATKPGS